MLETRGRSRVRGDWAGVILAAMETCAVQLLPGHSSREARG